MVLPETQSLIASRSVYRHLPASADTSFLYFTHGGMGDRINFQALVVDALRRRTGTGCRVVAVIPYHAGEYDAHDYQPHTDEVWVVPLSQSTPAFLATFSSAVRLLLPGAGQFEILICDDLREGQISQHTSGIRYLGFYRYLKTLAAAGHYADFALSAPALWHMRLALAQAGIDRTRPVIALHCRQHCPLTPGEAGKNPRIADMASLAKLLRERLDACIISIAGNEELPAELSTHFEFRVFSEPNLQSAALAIASADLFIGGDSGPGHLAAALGTPLLSLRPPAEDWLYGPFAPVERMETLVGSMIEDHGACVGFDPEAGFDAVLRILRLGVPEPPLAGPADGEKALDGGGRETFGWEDLFYLADLMEGGGRRDICFGGAGLLTGALGPAQLLYFLERGFRVEIRCELGEAPDPFLGLVDARRFATQLSVVYPIPVGTAGASPAAAPTLRRFGHLIVPELRLSAPPDNPAALVGRLTRHGVKPRCRLTLDADASLSSADADRSLAETMVAITRACRALAVTPELACPVAPASFTPGELGRLLRLAGGRNPFVRNAGISVGPGLQFSPITVPVIPAGSLYGFASYQQFATGCLEPLHDFAGEAGDLPCACPKCRASAAATTRSGVFAWL